MSSTLLKIRRSPAAIVDAVAPAEGELGYKTDTKKLVIGDGVTLGGNGVVMDSQLSTDAEAQAKAGNTVITAGNLAALNATETMSGLVEKATTAEAEGATANKFPDAAGVKAYVDQFGIGANAKLSNDWDTLDKSGVYYNNSTSATGIPLSQSYITVLHVRTSDTTAAQIAYRSNNTTPQTWRRSKSTSVWGAWVEVTDSQVLARYGIGTTSLGSLTTDYNLMLTSGFYLMSSTAPNSPNTSTNVLHVFSSLTSGRVVQVTYRTHPTSLLTESTYRSSNSDGSAWSAWTKFYDTSNIIGTVSESGGIPTGAIIETGSNANGRYIKYADGTMICHGLFSLGTCAVTTTTGSSFYTASTNTLTYAAGFIAAPTVTANCQNASTIWVTRIIPSTSTADIRLVSSTSTSTSISVLYTAIGRWY